MHFCWYAIQLFLWSFSPFCWFRKGQLSVSGKRMCTILVNRLEDKACPVKVWLGKLTGLDMTPMGWLGRKTSTQIKQYDCLATMMFALVPSTSVVIKRLWCTYERQNKTECVWYWILFCVCDSQSYFLNPCPAEPGYALLFANSADPDQLASFEANWSGSALFTIQCMNLYQQSASSNLIGWKFEKGVAS